MGKDVLRDLRRFHLERDHAAAARALGLVECILGMVGETYIVNIGDLGQTAQPRSDGACALCLALDTHAEGLEAAQHEPGVHRGEVRPLGFHEQFDLLCEIGVRILYGEEAADHIVVPAEILCAALDHDVCTKCERLLEMRREKGVVRGEERAMCVRDLCECADVGDEHHGVRGRFNEDELRLFPHP